MKPAGLSQRQRRACRGRVHRTWVIALSLCAIGAVLGSLLLRSSAESGGTITPSVKLTDLPGGDEHTPAFDLDPPTTAQEPLGLADTTDEASPDPATRSAPSRQVDLDIMVIDSAGQPVGDAIVEVWASEGAKGGALTAETPAQTLQTDLWGACRATLNQGAIRVFASKEGVGTSGLWRSERVPEEGLRIELRAAGRIIGEVVQSDGRPAPDAEVFIRPEFSWPAQPRVPQAVTTDRDGRFTVEVDAPFSGTASSRVRTESAPAAHVWVQPGQTANVVIRFGRDYGLTGVVVAPDGAPIDKAEVSLERGPDLLTIDGFEPEHSANTSGDGRFAFELAAAGQYSIIVQAEGWIQSDANVVTITENIPHVEIAIECVPAASIAGHVVWDDGQPIDDAFLMASLDEPELADMSFQQEQQLEPVTWTRADGSFRLGPLHPSLRYSLVVKESDAQAVLHGLMPGTTELIVRLSRQSSPRVSLLGRVIDLGSGSPIPRFETSVDSWSEVTGSSEMFMGWTAHETPDGRFVIPELRPEKSYAVSVRAQGFEPRTFRATLDGREHDYELGHRVGYSIAVVMESGEPAAGVKVVMLEDMNPKGLMVPRHEAVSGADGIVSFESLSPGEYWLMASGMAGAAGPTRVSVGSAAGNAMRLQLASDLERAHVQVSALDRQGRPISGATILLWPTHVMGSGPTDWDGGSMDTDGSGQAELTPRPGIYHVLARKDSLDFPQQRLIIGSRESVELDFRAE